MRGTIPSLHHVRERVVTLMGETESEVFRPKRKMTDKPVLSPWLGSYLGYPKTEQQKSVGATYWYGGGQGGTPEGSCLDAREYQ
jgi:hypothetical protein